LKIAVALLAAIALLGTFFAWRWFCAERRNALLRVAKPGGFLRAGIGFVANFFDTLGIGSFAPTTSIFKLRRLVSDELIPGTLNVGHTLPTLIQGLIFIGAVEVGALTLVSMLGTAILGAWFGAGAVAKMPRRKIQIGMGAALLVAAVLTVLMIVNWLPSGGTALQLSGGLLAVAVAVNFILGALMTLGIGLYAPCLVLVSLLGMNPIAAFPIMMGSCAFLMPVAAIRFVREQKYDLRAALGLTLGGIPAVLIAAFVVRSLPLLWLRWLVVIVAVYTAVLMLVSSRRVAESAAVRGEATL
jgi:uncharacterized membrane protein YfcA